MTPEAPRAGREGLAAWPDVRAASRRWLAVALVLAVIAHLPAMPFDPLFLARILVHTPADTPAEDSELLIPIDLDLLAATPSAEDSPPQPSAATPTPEPSPAPGPAPEPAPAAPDEGPAQPEAPAAPRVAAAAPKADDIYDGLDTPRHATSKLQDPLAVAGGPGKFSVKSPYVQVLFNGNRLRGNAAGAAMGGVLTALPEWKTFFDGTNIDPIGDTEHLLIAGPQLRRSRDVVVWMQYRVAEKEMRAALDTLVKRTKGGKWLADAPVPAAVARAHRYLRVFALVPGKNLLVILPYAARDQLAKVKSVRPFNQSSRAGIVISLMTPRNAFAGYEGVIDVPRTFQWMRMVVTPLGDGGADVALEIGDASAEAAAKDGPALEKQLGQVRTLASLATLIGAEVLPPMKVEVDRDILRVNATVSRKGLQHILNLARAHFAKEPEPEKKGGKDAKEEEESGGDAPAGSAGAAAPSAAGAVGSAAPSASAGAPSASAPGSAGAAPSASASASEAAPAGTRPRKQKRPALQIPLPRPRN